VQRTYNFEFVDPDLLLRIPRSKDLLPCLLKFLDAAEAFFKDLFRGDLAETLLVFSSYENPDLRVIYPVDLADSVAVAGSPGLGLLSAEDQRNKGALKENPLHL